MQFLLTCLVVVAVIAGTSQASKAGDRQVGHMVYFTLKKSTPETRQALVDSCNKYLSEHEGCVYYSAGVLAEDLDREVNVTDFDVALNLVFESRKAHDTYQTHARHLKFIEENKATWEKVRVFDSYIGGK